MPEGSTSIVKALANFAHAYGNTEYIYNMVAPTLPIMQDSGAYFQYVKNFRLEQSDRANGSPANQITYAMSSGTYNVQEHALRDIITDEDLTNTDKPLDLFRDTTEFLVDKIEARQEKIMSDLCFTTTSFGNNTTLTTATSWNYNTTTSDPLGDAVSITSFVRNQCGKRPNTLIIGGAVYDALKENQNLWTRLAYTERQFVTKDILSAMMDIEKVFVGESIYQTNKEGQTDTQTALWGNDALFAYMSPMSGRKAMTAVQNFRKMTKGNPYKVKRYRSEAREGWWVEVQTKAIPKVVGSNCAYLVKTASIA